MSKNQKKETTSSQAQIKEHTVKFLYLLAFIEGAMVIFSELIGAKILAPFFGTSLIVWTAVISTTISILTLGYYIGGKLSKKTNRTKTLAILFSLAGLFLAIIPSWSISLFEKFEDSSLIAGAIKTSLLLIGPSVLCFGISSPIIIQELSLKLNNAGKSAGQTYAISTIAGILSTLVIGFYLLPNFGTQTPLLIAAFSLIFVSFFTQFLYLNLINLFLFATICYSLINPNEQEKSLLQTHFTSEGLMGQLKVIDQSFAGSDIKYRLLFINGIPQTIIQNNDKKANSYWEYVHRISSTASLKKNGTALLFGMGGGAIASELQKNNMKLDIVDIDKRMYQIAQNYFHFKPIKTTNFTEDDARHYIKTCKKKYDFIVLDICSGEVQPSNVFTKEGITELKKIIKKDGIIIIQYQEKLNPKKLSGSQSIAKTFLENKFKVYQNIEKVEISSVILTCSLSSIDFTKLDSMQISENCSTQKWMSQFLRKPYDPILKASKNSVLLIDDKPILENINAETIEIWRKSMVQHYGLKLY